MSNSRQVAASRRRLWFAGIPLLVLAASLVLVYFLFPGLSANWTVMSRVLFRSVVVLIGMIGAAQIAAAWSPTRGTIATPGFGRHRMVLPIEGIVYLTIMFVLFTGAMLTKSNMLLFVFALMAGPFVINGWMTFGMLQSARIVRSAPQRAMVGELFGVELTLSNSRPLLSIWIMAAQDEIQHAGETLNGSVLFARVAPHSSQAGQYQLRLARRGRYRLGPIVIMSRFPLGLVERSRLFPVQGEILVYPRVGRLVPSWRRRWIDATELAARPQLRTGIFRDEFHRLREYRAGDNPRDIHWRSSARRGELILREYQQNRDFNLAVVLELWQPAKPNPARAELIERSLSFVATLLVQHGRDCRDSNLRLAVSGATTFRWQGQSTAASLESLFDGLAVIEAGPAVDTKKLVEETLQETSASTQIVVLTTRSSDDAVGDTMRLQNPRVDVVRLAEFEFDRVLVYEDEFPAAVAMPKPQAVGDSEPAVRVSTGT
jgi:uncharacterized protein (DUF58 family)